MTHAPNGPRLTPPRSALLVQQQLVRQLGTPLTAVAAGIVTAGGLPPVDISMLSVIGLTGGLAVLRCTPSARVALAAAFGFGLGYFGAALLWSNRFGVVVWLVLATSQALFWMPVGWAAWWSRGRAPARVVLLTAGVATLSSALRARVPLGGLEWAQLGVTAHGSPLRPAAALIGTLGLTALVATMAMSLAVALERPSDARAWRPLTVAIVVAAAGALLGAGGWTRPAGTLDIAVVQADPPCPGRHAVDCPDGAPQVLSQLTTATDELATTPDLIVWGEGVLTGSTPKAVGAELTALGRLQAPLLVGVTSPAGDGGFFNRNVLFDHDGEVLGAYAKRQPVPFGEYVPARDRLGRLHEVGRLVPNDMRRGKVTDPLPLGEVQLGTVSSWEVTFSRLVSDVAPDSHVLVSLTTQATYGRSSVSDQLLRAAALRAVEHQRSVIVAAATGRSAVIQPDGSRGPTTALYAAEALAASVELRHGRTPFSRVGDLPVAFGAFVAVSIGRRKTETAGVSGAVLSSKSHP